MCTRPCVHDDEDPSQCIDRHRDVAIFVGAGVRYGQGRLVVEHRGGIGEIDAVLSEVGSRLGIVPFEFHGQGVYVRMYTQSTSPVMVRPVHLDPVMIGTMCGTGFP